MIRMVRMTAALVLTLAVGALPLATDWCAADCESAHAAVHSAPTCHHTTAATRHISELPAPCGHDHQPIVVAAATIRQTNSNSTAAPTIAIASPCASEMALARVDTAPTTSPLRSSPSISRLLAATLRI